MRRQAGMPWAPCVSTCVRVCDVQRRMCGRDGLDGGRGETRETNREKATKGQFCVPQQPNQECRQSVPCMTGRCWAEHLGRPGPTPSDCELTQRPKPSTSSLPFVLLPLQIPWQISPGPAAACCYSWCLQSPGRSKGAAPGGGETWSTSGRFCQTVRVLDRVRPCRFVVGLYLILRRHCPQPSGNPSLSNQTFDTVQEGMASVMCVVNVKGYTINTRTPPDRWPPSPRAPLCVYASPAGVEPGAALGGTVKKGGGGSPRREGEGGEEDAADGRIRPRRGMGEKKQLQSKIVTNIPPVWIIKIPWLVSQTGLSQRHCYKGRARRASDSRMDHVEVFVA